MEAKGCAKAMVWKDARRRFYWAVRAKIARSAALAQLEEASPESTHDYRVHLLESIAGIEDITDPRIIAESLEKLDLTNTVAQLKADHLARRMLAINCNRSSMFSNFLPSSSIILYSTMI